MKKLNLKSKKNQKTNSFGILLSARQREFTVNLLNEIKKLCPQGASLKLNFEKTNSTITARLKIRSLCGNFSSVQNATDPLDALLLIYDDIEAQLLEWKRLSFSNSLFKNLTPKKVEYSL